MAYPQTVSRTVCCQPGLSWEHEGPHLVGVHVETSRGVCWEGRGLIFILCWWTMARVKASLGTAQYHFLIHLLVWKDTTECRFCFEALTSIHTPKLKAKLSQQRRYLPCHKNRPIKSTSTIPHNLRVIFKSGFPLLWNIWLCTLRLKRYHTMQILFRSPNINSYPKTECQTQSAKEVLALP